MGRGQGPKDFDKWTQKRKDNYCSLSDYSQFPDHPCNKNSAYPKTFTSQLDYLEKSQLSESVSAEAQLMTLLGNGEEKTVMEKAIKENKAEEALKNIEYAKQILSVSDKDLELTLEQCIELAKPFQEQLSKGVKVESVKEASFLGWFYMKLSNGDCYDVVSNTKEEFFYYAKRMLEEQYKDSHYDLPLNEVIACMSEGQKRNVLEECADLYARAFWECCDDPTLLRMSAKKQEQYINDEVENFTIQDYISHFGSSSVQEVISRTRSFDPNYYTEWVVENKPEVVDKAIASDGKRICSGEWILFKD